MAGSLTFTFRFGRKSVSFARLPWLAAVVQQVIAIRRSAQGSGSLFCR